MAVAINFQLSDKFLGSVQKIWANILQCAYPTMNVKLSPFFQDKL